jgi:hypothetical protein
MKTFYSCWESQWGEKATNIISDAPNFETLQLLGDNLRDIFLSTNEGGRSQGSLSGGGAAWECLITWYINLGLIGTRTIVLKHKKAFVPPVVAEALTVWYEGLSSNTESDLIAITFPDKKEACYNAQYLQRFNDESFHTNNLNAEIVNSFSLNEIDRFIRDNFSKIKINVIQCKTNWNDNAQIPMAWDMIYSSSSFSGREISIGSKSYSIFKLNNFTYSFVTVPTQKKLEIFKEKSTCVARVKRLSGHNFWGVQTKDKVAYSLGDIFELNYSSSFDKEQFESHFSLLEDNYFNFNKI